MPYSSPKILFIAHSFNKGNGGIAKVSRLMAKVIADQQIPCTLISLAGDGSDSVFGIPTHRFAGNKFALIRKARKYAKEYTHIIYDSPTRARLQAALWPYKTKVLTFCHGIEIWEEATPSSIRATQKSNMLLCNSSYTKERAYSSHKGLEHLQVCPLSTEFDHSPAQMTNNEKEPYVLIVGRMSADERYKGHEELIKSWETVIQKIPQARLHIVGEGDDKKRLEAIARQSPAAPHIHFLGKLSEKNLQDEYRKAALFAMPSKNEGFGLVYIEAMSYGTPILTSQQDAGKELIKTHPGTGFSIDLKDKKNLANTIIQYLQHPPYFQEMSKQAYKLWKEKYTFSSFKKEFSKKLELFLNT